MCVWSLQEMRNHLVIKLVSPLHFPPRFPCTNLVVMNVYGDTKKEGIELHCKID